MYPSGGNHNRTESVSFRFLPLEVKIKRREVQSTLAPPTVTCGVSSSLKPWRCVSGAEERLQRGDHGDPAGGGDGDVGGRL